tara:strand:+ start:4187 stop:4480 length:294 start_codon:yes stop_codon:yes gene_type:complete
MFEKVNIKEKNNQLEVDVKIESLGSAGKLRVHTTHVEEYLKNKGVKFGKCIKEIVLHNGSDHARIGTWAFELVKQSKPVSKITKKPRKTKTAKKQEG